MDIVFKRAICGTILIKLFGIHYLISQKLISLRAQTLWIIFCRCPLVFKI